MKKFLYFILVLGLTTGVTGAKEAFEHPVDIQESACKTGTQNLDEWTKCTLKAARAWNSEVDKYYSLLYKKLSGDAKTALYDNQKYWNLYKNNDTKERAVFRAVQKRDLIKTRAKSLRLYYIQTFPDDEHEKIEINNNQSGFQLDPMLQRGLRWLGF